MGEQKRTWIQRYGWLIGVGGVVVATTLYVVAHRNGNGSALAVTTIPVTGHTVTEQLFAVGTVTAPEQDSLYAPASAVASPVVKVTVGQKVAAGQVLASIPNQTGLAAYEAAQAAVQAQEAASASAQKLLAQAKAQGLSKSSPSYMQLQQTVQADRVQVENAKVSAMQAYSNVQAADLRTPIAGTVIAVNTQPSSLGAAPLVQVANLSDLQISAVVSQVDSVLMASGVKTEITSAAFPGKNWTGRVASISPVAVQSAASAGQGSAEVPITVTVPAGFPVHLGFSVNLSIDAKSSYGLAIPYSTLVENGSGSQVWIVKAGHAQLVSVTLGITGSSLVQVLSGLTAGDRVIVNPPATLVSGEGVRTA